MADRLGDRLPFLLALPLDMVVLQLYSPFRFGVTTVWNRRACLAADRAVPGA